MVFIGVNNVHGSSTQLTNRVLYIKSHWSGTCSLVPIIGSNQAIFKAALPKKSEVESQYFLNFLAAFFFYTQKLKVKNLHIKDWP